MKNKEELKNLKEEVENEKLQELTAEEIAQVSGGLIPHREHVIEPGDIET